MNWLKLKLFRYPSICKKLDLYEISKENINGLEKITVYFNRRGMYEVEFRIEDRQESVTRAFKYNKFGNSGQNIALKVYKNLTKTKTNTMQLSLTRIYLLKKILQAFAKYIQIMSIKVMMIVTLTLSRDFLNTTTRLDFVLFGPQMICHKCLGHR